MAEAANPRLIDLTTMHLDEGGTDIIACFAGQNCTGAVYQGEIQCRILGMAVECWDDDGKPVLGDVGELVCTKPFPSMPTHFWNDDSGIKYKNAYFTQWLGVWAHGDFIKINPDTGGLWMLGRSDGTLNPNGVRFGSAEIYHIVEQFKEIQDSLCVSQRNKTGDEERVILFLQMAPGSTFCNDIVRSVKASIRQQLSARHLPAVVLPTDEIPYTHNGKKVEVAVKKVISGEEVKVRGAYTNPNCIDLYANIPELQVLFNDCALEMREYELLTFLGCVVALKNRKQTSIRSYFGTVCMFAKMLSVVLFLRQSPLLGVIFVVLCIIHLAFLPEPAYSGPESVMYFSGGTNLQDELERDKRVTWLVEFYAAWLPSCVSFSAVYAPLSSKYSLDNFKFAKVDVTRYPEVAKAFNISTSTWTKQLPTLILFENGKEVTRRPIIDSKNRVACKFVFSEINVVQSFDLNNVYDKCKKNLQSRRKEKKLEPKSASLKKEE
ncbi:hypothetical protein LSAT2_006231 [Lamellibrachia satsuma]|nr:hypothetical protein LSAT2_006231 [Lamellibrachia satsuma]